MYGRYASVSDWPARMRQPMGEKPQDTTPSRISAMETHQALDSHHYRPSMTIYRKPDSSCRPPMARGLVRRLFPGNHMAECLLRCYMRLESGVFSPLANSSPLQASHGRMRS